MLCMSVFPPVGSKTSDGKGVGMDIGLCLCWVMRMEPGWRRMLAPVWSVGLWQPPELPRGSCVPLLTVFGLKAFPAKARHCPARASVALQAGRPQRLSDRPGSNGIEQLL